MTIGTKIIKRALQKIGAHSVLEPASPENIILGMENLNSMLQEWLDLDVQIEFTPLKKPGDELSEPTSARNAIISNLALYMAPDFDNGKIIVSDTLTNKAERDFQTIKTLYQAIDIPNVSVSGTTPKGSGNRRDGDERVFFRPGGELGGGSPGGGLGSLSFGSSSNGENVTTSDVLAPNQLLLGKNDKKIGTEPLLLFDGSEFFIASPSADSRAIFKLQTKGANGAATRDFVGTRNPEGNIAGNPGDRYHRVNGTDSGLFIFKGAVAGTVGWEEIGGGSDLDFSGDSGTGSIDLGDQTFVLLGSNGITTLAASQTITFSLDAANTVQTSLANLVAVGALISGSITSSFGAINIGSSPLNTTGAANLGSLQVTGTIKDTSGDVGLSGQVLSSTGTGTNWIDAGIGSGNVSNVGTPLDGQLSIWTGTTFIEGDPALTFDTVTDTLAINSVAVATIDDVEITDINADTSPALTAVLADQGQTVTMDSASANVFTIPTNASVPFIVGTVINVLQLGIGITTITAASGVTLNTVLAGSETISDQFGGVSLLKKGIDIWIATGAIGTAGGGGPSPDLNFSGDSGTGSVDLDTQAFVLAGGNGITSLAASQAITFSLDAANTVQTSLANLVTVQGLSVAYADAGENAIWGWADGGSTYRNLTQAEVQAIVGSGSGNVTTSDTLVATQLLLGNGTVDIVTEPDLTYNGTRLNLTAGKGISLNSEDIITEAAGTNTLSNINALDATTESTIEAAIDTLSNLTSIQNRTITLADAGTDAFFGWDDSANAYQNLTTAEVEAIIEPLLDTLPNLTSATSLASVGTLSSGSISPGFGSINIGSDPITTTGLGTFGSLRVTGTIADSSGDVGSSGQVLSSIGTGTNWIDAGGGGNVSNVGTPVNNQLAIWTGTTLIEGDTALTFDTSADTLAIGVSGNLAFGAVTILNDAAGSMALQNIDALDAITEATIENAIDTLPNLGSAASLTSVGALNSGSITSGFGGIDIGASSFDTTGLGKLGSLEVTGTIKDSSGDVGTSGQVLSSTVSGTNWIDAGGGGNVSNVGTPLDGQLAIWTSSNVIEGDSALTFNTITNTLFANSVAVATIDDVEVSDINADTSTALTAAITDRGQTVTMNNAAANVFTIPTNAAVAFDIGTVINVLQIGAGITTITAASGVTLNDVSAGSETISDQFGGVSLLKKDIDIWIATGAIGLAGGASDLDFAGDSGSGTINLGSEVLTLAGGSGISTVAAGNIVTINLDGAPSSAATQAQQEAGVSTTVFTSPGTQQFHQSAAKGWINLDQVGVQSIRGSYNVSSIVDGGVGITTINWDINFNNSNYCAVGLSGDVSGENTVNITSMAAGSMIIQCQVQQDNNNHDFLCVAAFGDQ